MSKTDNVIEFGEAQTQSLKSHPKNNDKGGYTKMDKRNNDNDYVTHAELELNNEKMMRKLDQQFNHLSKKLDQNKASADLNFEKINTKFEKQKSWFYGTAITIVVSSCTIIGFLIKFIH